MTEAPLTRRERQRRATMDEIVQTARGRLAEPGGLSLRAIAQEMGMTPPALYRYVSSIDDLTLTVAASIYDELVGVMNEAAARYAERGPEAQIVAGAVAYRQWALRHRDEFVLCFVNEVPDPDTPDQNACAIAGGRFRQFFAQLFVQIWQRRPVPVPSEEELGAAAAVVRAEKMNPFADDPVATAAADLPVGAHWLFLQVWTRLFGNVALEAFGHIAPEIVESAALFRTVLRDCGAMIGVEPDDVPGFEELVDAELRR